MWTNNISFPLPTAHNCDWQHQHKSPVQIIILHTKHSEAALSFREVTGHWKSMAVTQNRWANYLDSIMGLIFFAQPTQKAQIMHKKKMHLVYVDQMRCPGSRLSRVWNTDNGWREWFSLSKHNPAICGKSCLVRWTLKRRCGGLTHANNRLKSLKAQRKFSCAALEKRQTPPAGESSLRHRIACSYIDFIVWHRISECLYSYQTTKQRKTMWIYNETLVA